MNRDHNGKYIRSHKNQIVQRRCANETCSQWFTVSDDLFEQEFCCKPCKKTQNNRERRRRDQKIDSVVSLALAYGEVRSLSRALENEAPKDEPTRWEPF